MGRKKIEIQPITNERNRSVTFLKRRTGLFKKAYELGVLCSVDVAVIIFEKRQGHAEKLYQYCSSDIRGIVDRQRRFSGERDTRTPNDFSGNPNPSGAAGADDDAGDDDDDQDMADEPSGRGEGGEVGAGKPAGGEERGKRGRPQSVKAEGDMGIDMDYTSFSNHPHHNHPLSSNLASSASALSIPSLPFSFNDVSSLGGVPSISTSPTMPISSDRHTRSRLAAYQSHSHMMHQQQQSHQQYPSFGPHLSLTHQLGRYGNESNPNKRPRLSSTSLPSLDMHHSYPHHSPTSATSLVGRGSASSYLYDDSSPLHGGGSGGNGNSPFQDEHSPLHNRTPAPPSSSGGAGGYGQIKPPSRRLGGLPSSSSSNSSTPQPGYPGRTHSLSGPGGGSAEGGGGGGGPMSPGAQDIFAGVFGVGTESGSGAGDGGGGTRGNGGASGGGGGYNPSSQSQQHGSSDHPSSGGLGTGRGSRNGGDGGGNGGMVEGPNWLDLLATAVPDLDMGASSSSSIPPTSMSGSGSGLSGTNLGIEEERGDSEDGEGEFVGLDEGMGLDGFEMLGTQGRGDKKDGRSGGDSDG